MNEASQSMDDFFPYLAHLRYLQLVVVIITTAKQMWNSRQPGASPGSYTTFGKLAFGVR